VVAKPPTTYWNKTTAFQGIRVYQRNDLINPYLKDKTGRTNLQRMKSGIAPIGSIFKR
jgi:hypothetical protein